MTRCLGIAACLLISLYVAHELTYDQWNVNADRIVRPVADISFGSNKFNLAVVGSTIGPDCGKELPEVQSWCRFRDNGSFLIRREGESQQNIRENNVLKTDSTFFEVFPARIIEGDPAHALTRPQSLAISHSMAEKYFSAPQLAIGQTLVLENKERWQITAVFEDFPANTHFKADFLLAMNGDQEIKDSPPVWGASNNWQTYLLLHKGVGFKVFEQKFQRLTREKMAISVQAMLGSTIEEFEKTGQYVRYPLQRLTDIHLHSDLNVELRPNGSIQQVWIFSAIAGFILLIACINFMNLATARSAGRAKEVGVRKSLGSGRGALMSQFLTESVLISGIAVVLAIILATAALPWFSTLADRNLLMPWQSVPFWLIMAGATIFVGLLAGSYPAFFLSAFTAVRVLKGEATGIGRGSNFRSALVVFQFAASVALIISTLLVTKQLDFIQSKKLGFAKNQVIIVDDTYALGDNLPAFKTALLQHPAIEKGTVSGFLPIASNRSDRGVSIDRSIGSNNTVSMQSWQVDADYIPTLGMELVYGRNFDPSRTTDSSCIIINETAARLYGFQGDPSGKNLYTLDSAPSGNTRPEDFKELTVIGVVKDFHWASLRENIGALYLQLGRSSTMMSFRYQGAESASVIAALEKTGKHWHQGSHLVTALWTMHLRRCTSRNSG
jgi:putative ABC transport system permease protein